MSSFWKSMRILCVIFGAAGVFEGCGSVAAEGVVCICPHLLDSMLCQLKQWHFQLRRVMELKVFVWLSQLREIAEPA